MNRKTNIFINFYNIFWDKMKLFTGIVLFFLFTIPITANDFYPLNITPANGSVFDVGSTVPISFDVCLGYDYPALANEWRVEIKIFNANAEVVYSETIDGFNVNGPACYPINNTPDFIPSEDGTYYLHIQTYYDQEINDANDLLTTEFDVRINKDLAVVSILSPQQDIGGLTFFAGVEFDFEIFIRNEGNVKVSGADYKVRVMTYIQEVGQVSAFISYSDETVDIEPGAEMKYKVRLSNSVKVRIPTHLNEQFQFEAYLECNGDQNSSNDSFEGSTITFIPNPIWPNEIGPTTGLNKTVNGLANNDFVEFIVTDKFSDPELYSLMVYDSSGHQVDSTSLNLFTVGETVDSFTVYSYEYNGDVLPNNGAIALAYDSLRFSDYFISWGGAITATEGLWKDSTSTDIGITPFAGNSISLSGQGTDFSSFTWENSTPTPGSFNDSQLVPVEEQPTLANQYRLEQNYPNPFNPTTTISYRLSSAVKSEKANVKLVVFDILGREMKTLVNKIQSPGNYEVIFEASNLPSGIYYYRLKAGHFIETKKMLLIK